MRYCIKTVLALSCLTFAMQFTSSNAFATSTPSFSCGTKKLSDAQCVIVRKALADYIVIVKKLLGANNLIGKALITLAQKDTDKVCPLPPPPPPGNGWTADTQNECTVLSSDHSTPLALSIDASGNFTDVIGAGQTVVCMSASACSSIVSPTFNTFGPTATQRCSDPNDLTVIHYTDAQVQSKIDALPPGFTP